LATHHPKIQHLPALDGLRGLAVAGVVAFHANGALKGGYLGVDLFFVLSGFLITSILLAEVRATNKVDLATFWVRRARRLFPALLSIMPAIAAYAWLFATRDELESLRKDAYATLAYVANWREIFSNKSYWDLFAAPSPLEHTWSLAIEEQFYVVWPLLVTLVLVWLHRSTKFLLATTLMLAAASVFAMVHYYDPENSSRAYFGTDTRAVAILVGAAFAMAKDDKSIAAKYTRALDVAGFVALAGMGFAWATLDGQDPFLYRGGFWLTELGALVLIACATLPNGWVARLFSFRPLARLGTISYGVYLWHWPIDCVMTLDRVHVGNLTLNALRVLVTLTIALISERFLERPIRSNGLGIRYPVLVTLAAFAASALLVVRATRLPPLLPTLPPPPPAVLSGHISWPGPFSVDVHTLPPSKDLAPGTLRVLVIGDSVSQKLGLALRFRQEEANAFVAERGVGNCSILETLTVSHFGNAKPADDSHNCAADWVKDTAELKPDVTFIVLGGAYFAKMTIDGKTEYACDKGWHEAYRTRLESLIDQMGSNAGRLMIMLAPYPLDRWRYEHIPERVDCFNDIAKEVSVSRHADTIDVMGHICPTKECNRLSNGDPIRPDGLHPDGRGSEELARWTLTEIRTLTLVDAGP
jgi:peptidoglycan/LPS O-acetylase OafA/YrhL/lysophospholipase L1-like esterase